MLAAINLQVFAFQQKGSHWWRGFGILPLPHFLHPQGKPAGQRTVGKVGEMLDAKTQSPACDLDTHRKVGWVVCVCHPNTGETEVTDQQSSHINGFSERPQ